MIEQFREYLSGQNPEYLMAGAAMAAGAAGLIVGGLVGRMRSGRRELYAQREHDERMARLNAENAKAQVDLARTGNEVELRRMEYEETQKDYDRKEAYGIKVKRDKLDNREYKTQQIAALREKIGPSLEKLAEAMKTCQTENGSQIERARADYRAELIRKVTEELDGEHNILNESYDVEEDVADRIERIVDMRYPAKSTNNGVQVPEEIKELVRILKEI